MSVLVICKTNSIQQRQIPNLVIRKNMVIHVENFSFMTIYNFVSYFLFFRWLFFVGSRANCSEKIKLLYKRDLIGKFAGLILGHEEFKEKLFYYFLKKKSSLHGSQQ